VASEDDVDFILHEQILKPRLECLGVATTQRDPTSWWLNCQLQERREEREEEQGGCALVCGVAVLVAEALRRAIDGSVTAYDDPRTRFPVLVVGRP